MIPEYLSPLANHLWQSTLVFAVTALLALLLRKNAARVRYCLWFTAALKFLIPFSLLMNIGQRFEWRTPPVIAERPISAVAEISMPFVVMPTTILPAPPSSVNPIPVIFWSLWLCGFVVSVSLWVRSWWRIRSALNAAWPLNIDLPINAVPVRVMSSKGSSSPRYLGSYVRFYFCRMVSQIRCWPDSSRRFLSMNCATFAVATISRLPST